MNSGVPPERDIVRAQLRIASAGADVERLLRAERALSALVLDLDFLDTLPTDPGGYLHDADLALLAAFEDDERGGQP